MKKYVNGEYIELTQAEIEEIWDKETYNEFMAQTMEESFEEALELLRL